MVPAVHPSDVFSSLLIGFTRPFAYSLGPFLGTLRYAALRSPNTAWVTESSPKTSSSSWATLGQPALDNALVTAERVVVVAPHPDDETLGCAILISRLTAANKAVCVAFLTNGVARESDLAPHFLLQWGSYEDYRKARLEERSAVLKRLGAQELLFRNRPSRSILEESEDAFKDLRAAVRNFPGRQVILTPAYEGGHPDHDLANCLVYCVALESKVLCIEYALYWRSRDSHGLHSFVPNRAESIGELHPSPSEAAFKQCCLELYRTQYEPILSRFSPEVERFRIMPPYDYTKPAVDGPPYYEGWNSGISSAQVTGACSRLVSAHSRLQAAPVSIE